MVCAQYSNIVAYALKKAVNIDTTSLLFSFVMQQNKKPGRHEMLFLDNDNSIIETTNTKSPTRYTDPNTLKK